MTEAPSGGPSWDRDYEDRNVKAEHPPQADHSRPAPTAPAAQAEPVEPPFEGPLHALSQAAWQVVLLTGLASLILGVLVLIWPGPSLIVAGVLFGVYLVVSGVFQIVAAFGTHKKTSLRVLAFVSGGLSILLGLFCFRGAMQSILLLGLWIGIGWLIRGITQTMAAISDSTMPARGWQIFLGVVTFLAGIVLIDSPVQSVAILTLVAGWWLIVVGIVEIVTSFGLRGRAKKIPQTV
ncbi:HdeD family acid-resistance protein [Streptomyces sp. NPDC048297]|uniref:HdeD family acid-resistance protein n=1 Tax=Streptomyces sp. NPDC048297 TaxID=3365531 RepID=UPI003712467F